VKVGIRVELEKKAEKMSRNSSLPTQIPILPLYDQAVLFPGLLLRLRITSKSSTALLSHILRSDQATLINLVLGCIPVRPGSGIAEIIGEGGNARPALLAPESTQPEKSPESKSVVVEAEYGCSARIKSLSRLDRSYGTTGFVLVVEGIPPCIQC
jgi:Lon protease-like protein